MNPGKIVRASRMNDRTLFRYKPDYRVPEMRDGARLVGLSGRRRRFPGRGGDVQQQRRMPQARRRRDVPLLPRHRQRARRDARPRQLAAARHLRPARPRRLRLRRHAGDDEAVRLLQGLPARVPDRRRHGQDEDRGAGRRQRAPRAVPARPAGRLPAALCALCGAPCAADECAQRHSGARRADRARSRASPPSASCRAGAAMCFRVPTGSTSPSPRSRGEGRGEGQQQSPDARGFTPHPSPLPVRESGNRASVAREVALFADTFNTYFEPENLHAAVEVLDPSRLSRRRRCAAGGGRARRCAAGARSCRPAWSRRRAPRPGACWPPPRRSSRAACPIVGLEPSCLLTLRDEFIAMLPGAEAERLASQALLLEEFLAARGRRRPHRRADRRRTRARSCCTATATRRRSAPWARSATALALVEGLEVETVESSCCGMAGAFGYGADTYAGLDGHGRAVACCRPCAGPRPTPSSPPTASPAATRSTTAPAAPPCTSPASCAQAMTGDGRAARSALTIDAAETTSASAVDCDQCRHCLRWTPPAATGRLISRPCRQATSPCDWQAARTGWPRGGNRCWMCRGIARSHRQRAHQVAARCRRRAVPHRARRSSALPAASTCRFGQLSGIGSGLMPKSWRCWSPRSACCCSCRASCRSATGWSDGHLRGPIFVLGARARCSPLTIRAAGRWSSPDRLRSSSPRLPTWDSRPRASWSHRWPWCITLLCGLLFKELLNLPIPFDPAGLIPDPVFRAYVGVKSGIAAGVRGFKGHRQPLRAAQP